MARIHLRPLLSLRSDFSPEKPCESVVCEKHRYAFLQCEPDFWLVLVSVLLTCCVDLHLLSVTCVRALVQVVANPFITHPPAAGAAAEKKTGKGAASGDVEYLEDELDDAVLQAILKRCYNMFRVSLMRALPPRR